MSSIGRIKEVTTDEGNTQLLVEDGNGREVTCVLYCGSNVDYRPLRDDVVLYDTSPETGENVVTAVLTGSNAGDGEAWIFGRDGDGDIVSSVKLGNDGVVTINDGTDSVIKGDTFNGDAKNPASYSGHVHPTAFGLSGPPTSGILPTQLNDTVKV
jgi:hypothetical protein